MYKKRVIAAFDFDGTLIDGDSFVEFSIYALGKKAFWCAVFRCFPYLLLYKLRLYPNWKAKERLFTALFKGVPISKLNSVAERFFADMGEKLLKKEAVECVRRHIQEGNIVVVVSASVVNWVRPFAAALGISVVLATELESDNEQKITGKFATLNCYGREKVNRLLERFPNKEDYMLYAYGDSNGDRDMIVFADRGFYRRFQ